MNVAYRTCAVLIAVLFLFPAVSTAMELDSFLAEVNVRAHADLGVFRADLRATFGVSSRDVDELFEVCDSPADVYMTLRIGQVARVSIERVVAEYRAGKDRGWGAIAKSLGIKPGSAEFHALKNGRLPVETHRASSSKRGKGHGANKGKR